eukprot:SAG25_NODE_33_length_20262_cov_33.203293_19_plen_220_part_00
MTSARRLNVARNVGESQPIQPFDQHTSVTAVVRSAARPRWPRAGRRWRGEARRPMHGPAHRTSRARHSRAASAWLLCRQGTHATAAAVSLSRGEKLRTYAVVLHTSASSMPPRHACVVGSRGGPSCMQAGKQADGCTPSDATMQRELALRHVSRHHGAVAGHVPTAGPSSPGRRPVRGPACAPFPPLLFRGRHRRWTESKCRGISAAAAVLIMTDSTVR